MMRKPRPWRIVYWLIMLPALAAVIWYFAHQVGEMNKLMPAK